MKSPFLIGKQVYLRGIEKEDLPKFVAWINDCEVTYYMFMGDRPAHLEILIEQWEKEIRDPNEVVFAIVDKEGDKVVGSSGLYSINWISRLAEYRIFVGEKKYWGKGHAGEAGKLVIKYGFEKLNLNRIYLGVNAENIKAVLHNRRLGFIQEGVLREEIFRNDKYYNVIRMGMLKKDYFKMKKKGV